MNISLICEKKEYNFSLPLEVSLKYIKNLSSKIFKCKAFDIYYKGDKITKEEEDDEEEIFLRDIISCEESNIKLKIILNSTANNSKNQTPSTTNSPTYSNQTYKTLDVGANDIIQLAKKFYNQKNKLFEAIYSQKVKKLFSSIKEFNKKIIEIDYFLFKKNSKSNDNNLMSFEKNLYEFIDGIRLYFTKLYTILEINNYVTYDEMIHNLNNFYKYLNLNDDLEQELNIQNNHEAQTITSTPINKFPINLKKSENTLNLDTYNYFNKSTKKPSIKNSLLLGNKIDKNKFQLKASLLKDIKNINKNEGIDINNKGNYEFINLFNKNKNYVNKEIKNIIENIDENEKLEKNEDNNNENNIEEGEEKNNIYENIKLDKTSEKKNENDSESLKKTQTNISEKSINNISAITKKTTKSIESNKNNSSEEDIKEIKNSLNKSENSNNSKEQIVPLNLDLIKNIDSKKENEEIKLQNKVKQSQPPLNQKKSNLKKLNLDSTIQENENENILSSLDNTNNSNKKNNKNNNNKSVSEKKINKKEKYKNVNNSNKNVAKIVKDSPPKEQKINFSVSPPIYHINSSDETEMAKVLSRRLTMKKKKNKTANKYDFII